MAINKWSELGLISITTADGSPSLRLLKSVRPDFDDGESMHHSGGALSETIYIYAPVFEGAVNSTQKRTCHLIVGLGLGYIEMLIAIKSLQSKIASTQVGIVTFEKVEELRLLFLDFLNSKPMQEEILLPYENALNQMLSALNATDITPQQVKEFLIASLEIRGALDREALRSEFYHGIYFDAYSKKTSPDLWTEDFLFDFFQNFADKSHCYVGTYACNGNLKRTLKKCNFNMAEKLGFMAKRDATLAWRFVNS